MDKRIAKTREKACEGALQVIAERGFACFAMEAVAEVTGIAKSTLYRHWPDRMTLLADALETLNRQPPQPAPLAPGALRARVVELVSHLADVFASSRIARVIPALAEAAEHHPAVASFLHGYSAARRQALVIALRQGIEHGELPGGFDPELASLALSGPIFYCRTMSPTPFPRDRVEALVDLILRTPGPRQSKPARAREKVPSRRYKKPRA